MRLDVDPGSQNPCIPRRKSWRMRERERKGERVRERERKGKNRRNCKTRYDREWIVRRDACDRSFFFSFCENIINYLKGRKRKWQKNTVVTSQLYVVNITISNIMSLLTGESFSLPTTRGVPRTRGEIFYISEHSRFQVKSTKIGGYPKKVKYFISKFIDLFHRLTKQNYI